MRSYLYGESTRPSNVPLLPIGIFDVSAKKEAIADLPEDRNKQNAEQSAAHVSKNSTNRKKTRNRAKLAVLEKNLLSQGTSNDILNRHKSRRIANSQQYRESKLTLAGHNVMRLTENLALQSC